MTRQYLGNSYNSSGYGFDSGSTAVDHHRYSAPRNMNNYSLHTRPSPRSDPMGRSQPRTSPTSMTTHPHPSPHTHHPATLQSNNTGQSPRRRIPVACARCRKRKIRCSGDPGDNTGCLNCKGASLSPGSCQFARVNSFPTDLPNAITTASYSAAPSGSYQPPLPRYPDTTSILLPSASTDYYSATTAAPSASEDYLRSNWSVASTSSALRNNASSTSSTSSTGNALYYPDPTDTLALYSTFPAMTSMGASLPPTSTAADKGLQTTLPMPTGKMDNWAATMLGKTYPHSERSTSSGYSSANSSYVHVPAVGLSAGAGSAPGSYASSSGAGSSGHGDGLGDRRSSKAY